MRLTRRSSSVRRSFSVLTATALVRAAASMAIASCKGARMRISVAPKRAVSPAVTIDCVAVTTSQQVAMMPKSEPQ